jgi:GWxTD domain-containing protein
MPGLKKLFIPLLSFGVIFAYGLTVSARGRQNNSSEQGDSQDQTRHLTKKQQQELMKELGNPYKNWISGPISYIITPAERKAFDQLQTNGEREQFIEEFWARRNPDPGSEENTFKDQFYQRVAYANEHFSSGVPGWRTDRGRIYIMWGPPTSVESHPTGGTYIRPMAEGGGETDTYPFEDWTYRYLPGIGENVVLEFVDPTMSGEYYLTTDPSVKDALLNVPNAGLTELESMGLASKSQRFSNTDGTHMAEEGQTMPQSYNEFNRLELYAKIFQPPPVKYKDLEAIVSSRIIRSDLPFQYRYDVLRITDSTDLVPVSVQIPDKVMSFKDKDGVETAKLHIFGQISTVSGRVAQTFEDPVEMDIPNSLFKAQSAIGQAIYQKAVPLRPGLYKLDLVVKDLNSGNVGVIDTRLPVPQYNETKLSASTLILANNIEGVSSNNIGLGMFVLGDVKVVPQIDAAYRQNQTLGFYMQVYNLKMDPKTHHSNATINFLVTSGSKTLLNQNETSAQLGDTGEQLTIDKKMALASLAPGRYKLQITVHDNVSKQDVVQAADFTVLPPAKAAMSQAAAQ